MTHKLKNITNLLHQIFRQPENTAKFATITPLTAINGRQTGNMIAYYFAVKANRTEIIDEEYHEPCTEQERQEAYANAFEELANLWHGQNIHASISHIYFRMNLLKVIWGLYKDRSDFTDNYQFFELAVNELEAFGNCKKHGTPQENRDKLQTLELFIRHIFKCSEYIPAQAFDAAAIYNAGHQVIYNFNVLMTTDPVRVAAAFKVIHGSSVESIATKYQLKQSEVKNAALEVGQILYRMGFVTTDFGTIEIAETIPKLRKQEYIAMANLNTLWELALQAQKTHCEPFEAKFGISQIDWSKYRANVYKGMTAINKLLNPTVKANIFQAS